MIEEKHLKKGFIIATLLSTVIGTFTTSINLYERVRDRHKQHKTDKTQDDKIRELERRADDSDKRREQAEREKHEHAMAVANGDPPNFNKGNGRGEGNGNGNGYGNGGNWGPGRGNGLGRPQNDLRDALAASGPMIQREYDRDYARLGPRFAVGDQIGQTQLQAQVIDLQASVIKLLQDAVVTGVMPDPALLYAAAGRARNGSIRALQDQYQRLLVAAPLTGGPGGGGRKALRSASVAPASDYGDDDSAYYGYDRRRSSLDDYNPRLGGGGRRSQSSRRAGPLPPPPTYGRDEPPLFCRYAMELQHDWRRPLDMGGVVDGDDADIVCPACAGQFAIELDRSWKMHKPVVVGERVEEVVNKDNDAVESDLGGGDDSRMVTRRRKNIIELVEDRVFVLSNRFIVKCHRPAGYDPVDGTLLPPTYACCLCDRFDGNRIAVCGSMNRLVNHVCEKHTVGELISDPDIEELRPRRGGGGDR